MKKYVTYLRVSTQKQGASGLGLDAQRKMCMDFIKNNKGEFVNEFIDIESGTHRDRKGLWQAIEYCQKNGCSLVIAKLDRLARDVEFTFKVINTGIDIHFTDMPMVNTMILGVFASVAQYERELISTRTRSALHQKKVRGEKLGGATKAWRDARASKTQEQLANEREKGAITKRMNFLRSRETQMFIKALRKAFPNATIGEPSNWDWKNINTKGDNKFNVLIAMKDIQDLDPTGKVFEKWDFDGDVIQLQVKLAIAINTLKRSVK